MNAATPFARTDAMRTAVSIDAAGSQLSLRLRGRPREIGEIRHDVVNAPQPFGGLYGEHFVELGRLRLSF